MDRRIVAVLLILGLASVVLPGVLQSSSTSADSQEPRPFDPLSAAERDRAIHLATTNDTVAGLLDARTETIGAALRTVKTNAPLSQMPRLADVWFYNYETDQTVWAIANLDDDSVQSLVDAPDYQPPLTRDEIDRAGRMALNDSDVQQHLPDEDLQWIGFPWTGEGETTCPESRCVLIAFVAHDDVLRPRVRVNLSDNAVEAVFDGPITDGSDGVVP